MHINNEDPITTVAPKSAPIDWSTSNTIVLNDLCGFSSDADNSYHKVSAHNRVLSKGDTLASSSDAAVPRDPSTNGDRSTMGIKSPAGECCSGGAGGG
jgi:hypothetical protein